MRTKNDMRVAHDHLHAARKFTSFGGYQDDRTHAAKHIQQAVLIALTVHARGMSYTPAKTSDLALVLDAILEKQPGFLRDLDLSESSVRSIGDWATLDIYDAKPAPAKEALLAAISIAEILSVPWVNLLDPEVEPTDEELDALMREVTKA